jgi:hypothetical protein
MPTKGFMAAVFCEAQGSENSEQKRLVVERTSAKLRRA